jgi:mono/diheme cytochrome c family protein
MKRILGIGVVALSFAFVSGSAFAGDAAGLYKSKCAPCHGAEGAGTAMAPAHKGNEFVKSSSADQIAAVIKNGREGAAKKYKQYPIGMPAQKTMSDADIKDLVGYLKELAAK